MNTVQSNPLRILVADDERAMLMLYREVLSPKKDKSETFSELGELADKLFGEPVIHASTQSFDLITCRQGDEAIEAVKKSLEEHRPFAVAFLDVRMPPGPDGVWVAEQIRALDPHIEIVLVTAYSDVNPIDIAHQVPPPHKLLYIQKPFHPQEIHRFATALGSKWHTEHEFRKVLEDLERRIEERTVKLMNINEQLIEELLEEIEERKGVEERLRFTRFSVERSEVATFWLEADGKVFHVNDAACWSLGYSREELLSMTVHDFNPALPPEVWEDFWQHLTQARHIVIEARHCTNDGRVFPVEIDTNYFEYDGREYCFSFARDITERKRVETELRKAKEAAEEAQRAAEAANQAKSIFLANMSHELRTPLNGILGYTQILKRDPSLTGKQREAIETIHSSGDHLLLLINDILDLSKIEAHKSELVCTEFHLPRFLQAVVDIAQIRAGQKAIPLRTDIAPDLPDYVRGDEKRLRQILLNLLSNAIKFTEQGRVTFRVSVCSQSRSLRSDVGEAKERHSEDSVPYYKRIRFEVEDTGIGIVPERLEEIFLPFHQVGDKRVQAEGTGLGLAISQRLVRMMGGELSVNSTVGKGSTFWFELELPEVAGAAEAETLKEWKEILGFKGDTRTILIADDNEKNREVLKDLLLSLGFDVVEAAHGRDALDKAIECRPDIIFMDLIMPVMDGFEATRQIRQIPALNKVVVIAVSASAFEQTKEESLAAGCDDFLPKPIQVDSLLERLQVYLKLEWIYADEEKPPEPIMPSEEQPIIPPPAKELATLLHFAMMGDVLSLQEHLKQIEMSDTKFVPFRAKLHALAKEFLVDEIQEFLRQYMERKE